MTSPEVVGDDVSDAVEVVVTVAVAVVGAATVAVGVGVDGVVLTGGATELLGVRLGLAGGETEGLGVLEGGVLEGGVLEGGVLEGGVLEGGVLYGGVMLGLYEDIADPWLLLSAVAGPIANPIISRAAPRPASRQPTIPNPVR